MSYDALLMWLRKRRGSSQVRSAMIDFAEDVVMDCEYDDLSVEQTRAKVIENLRALAADTEQLALLLEAESDDS